MTIQEVNNILFNMSYMEYAQSLIEKYGSVPKDYFYTNKKGLLTKSYGITRGNEGLYIHHIFECYYIDLSNARMVFLRSACSDEDPRFAEAQKAENLCYCNLLEHLILHIKIALEYQRPQYEVGIRFITTDLNRLYDLGDQHLIKQVYSAKNFLWKQAVYQLIKDDYKTYVLLILICIKNLNMSAEQVCSAIDSNLEGYTYKKLYRDVRKALRREQ